MHQSIMRPLAIVGCAGALFAGGALAAEAFDNDAPSFDPAAAAQLQQGPGGPQGQQGPGGPQGQQGPGGPQGQQGRDCPPKDGQQRPGGDRPAPQGGQQGGPQGGPSGGESLTNR